MKKEVMLAIKRSHIRLLVNRFKDCFLFYRDVLELPVRYGDENSDYAEFKTDAIHIALFQRLLMAEVVDKADQLFDADIQDRVALILRVDDVTTVYKKLMAKGVEFVTGPLERKEWGCQTTHLRDPDGNLIEINADL
jgi:catechol 2,3-dioxygenase-like lactoylglutathione lyase family enzyme